MSVDLLDPAAAAAAGARHGQMASGLVEGGLAISCHKLVEDGARTMILLAPGCSGSTCGPSRTRCR